MEIKVEFPTWKTLTALLRDEDDSYDAVIQRLLAADASELASSQAEDRSESEQPTEQGEGAYFKDVFLPEGTELRATHKGKTYFAKISGSEWIDGTTGQRRNSPSQAAYFITNNHVNGWLFWLVKRPNDDVWHSLNALRAGYLP
jgi:hypothetical protein